MAKSKGRLSSKMHHSEQGVKRVKRARRQETVGTNKVWLRTRHRVRKQLLGG